MPRILVRAAQDPTKVLGADASTRRMGGNAGNLLFGNAVIRTLSGRPNRVEWGGYEIHNEVDPTPWIDRVNRRYAHYVVPLANAFRYGYGESLEAMTRIIHALDMPVTVVGVGAQTTADAAEHPERTAFAMGKTGSLWKPDPDQVRRHDGIVRRFVEAVLEKSRTIGVRGPVTKRYLESIGVSGDRVDVIGCPSVFTWGPDLVVEKGPNPLTAESAVSMNIDFRVAGIGAVIEKNAEMYPRLTSPVQDARSARMIIGGRDQYDMTERDPRTPIHTGHRLYQEGRLLYFPSPWGWIASFRDQQFAFGNRLHGNIAAILAGTPAHLLAHDSRTLELARFHEIPYSLLSDFDEPPSAAELWDLTDYTAFNEAQPQRFATFVDFLRRNGLATAYDGGSRPSARFDRRISRGMRTGPVRPSADHK